MIPRFHRLNGNTYTQLANASQSQNTKYNQTRYNSILKVADPVRVQRLCENRTQKGSGDNNNSYCNNNI